MNAPLLRRNILLALGLAGLGCEQNPTPNSAYEGSSVPPIETIAPPPPGPATPPEPTPDSKVVALPPEQTCGGGGACMESTQCEAPRAGPLAEHYPAPYERCRVSNYPAFSVQLTNSYRMTSMGVGGCCYRRLMMHPKGRPLRHDDEAIVPAIVRGPQHLPSFAGELELAERFVEIARIEHSSVASFADLSLSLLAHGAPIELVEGAHRAALDEIAHATAALEIASSIDGVVRTAGRMPIPAGDRSFHALVRSTVIDGCFGEVMGTLEAVSESSDDPAIAAFFEMVAEEEARHAVLAFRIVRWALEHDRAAAEAAIRDGIEVVGRADARQLEEERNAVSLPCLTLLLNGRALEAAA
jgi:hypothetical protein